MRRVLILIASVVAASPVHAGPIAWTGHHAHLSLPSIDLSKIGAFGGLSFDRDDSLLLSRTPTALPSETERSFLPGFNLGPFHAMVGGLNGRRVRGSSTQLDSRDFASSGISGSGPDRGPRLTFSLPIH
jgi:hypothetical protein